MINIWKAVLYCSFALVIAKVNDKNPKMVINDCIGTTYSFGTKKYWSISANAHCNKETVGYAVHQLNDEQSQLWEGVYEPYGKDLDI